MQNAIQRVDAPTESIVCLATYISKLVNETRSYWLQRCKDKTPTSFRMFRREKRKVQSQIGLSTKHSFITTVRNNADRGERTAAYFSACGAFCCICIFCCTFRPFLLCFLAKRRFLKNLGSTCKRIGNFMNIGHNLQSYSNRAMTKNKYSYSQ